jgi:hypothetical protein
VEIPGAGRQFVEDVGLEGGEVATGALEAIDQLIFAQPVNGARRGGEGGDENEARGIGGVGVAIGQVDLLNLGVATVGDVMRDGFTERGIDGANLGSDLVDVEINIVGTDQVLAAALSDFQRSETTICIRRMTPRVC